MRAQLLPFELSRVAWQETAYLVQYGDPVALERLFGSKNVEVRRIRRGVAHVVIPEWHETPEAALDWLEGVLSE